MTELSTIAKEKPAEPSLNYDLLRQEGLKHIESLARRIWTDYNLHDPGVTILELLCYAITDLGYRISLPLEDILADESDGQSDLALFHSGAAILPMAPLTQNDYRKLLLDCDGVKNAWLNEREGGEVPLFVQSCGERLTSDKALTGNLPIALKGFYDVALEIEEGRTSDSGKIIAAVRKRLMENRNLCEDFLDISVVARQQYILCAEIDIDLQVQVEQVEAAVFVELQRYLTPEIRFYSLEEMLERGVPTEDIFLGPLLRYGFIDDCELEQAQPRTTIPLSDVIRIIMAVPGIKGIREIRLACQDPSGEGTTSGDPWNQQIPKNTLAILNPDRSRIVFYKGHVPLQANRQEVTKLLAVERNEQTAKKVVRQEDIAIPSGRYRHLGHYETIQNDFPATYGIGREGLAENVTDLRRTQAKQLKAYLLFFDQVLANYFAQLAHVRALFSWDTAAKKTYFSQIVEGVAGLEELYLNPEELQSDLDKIIENDRQFDERRNRFLDHLLARFAENFSDYTAILYSLFRETGADRSARTKAAFLSDYGASSYRRALAYDYSDKINIWDTDKVSGLEWRLAGLLGIENFKRRNLANIKYEIYQEKDDDDIVEYRFRVIDETSGKILLSSSTKYRDAHKATEEMRRAVTKAMTREGIDLKETQEPSGKRYYFNIVGEEKEVLARRIEYFKTAEKRDEAIGYLLDFLIQRYSDEGFFLIEHPLLRPRRLTDSCLPLCPEAAHGDIFARDPYSFRVTFVLPAYSPRFDNMAFRRHTERSIRLETPSHLLPRICWIDKEQMAIFETAYRQWLDASVKGSETKRAASLKQLVETLSTLKNVYDPATLFDCSRREEQENPFILDRTILGTKE
ncbi:MAG: diguanylate cyclase [Pseudomonadota bacterium]